MDKEGLKGNLKLALFGAGCTNDYAEKGSEAVLDIIIEEKRLAKKEVFDEEIIEINKFIQRLRGYGCGQHIQLDKQMTNRIKELKRHLSTFENKMEIQHNQIYNEDCLQFMKQLPDNYFDLIITDPPYGIGCDEWDKEVKKEKKVMQLIQTINGIQRFETKINSQNELRKLFRRKTLLCNMENIDEMKIVISWIIPKNY